MYPKILISYIQHVFESSNLDDCMYTGIPKNFITSTLLFISLLIFRITFVTHCFTTKYNITGLFHI